MPNPPSHVLDRAETRAARAADRDHVAQAAWMEPENQQRTRDERPEPLRALRLERERQQQGESSITSHRRSTACGA
ncbi:hypothetical protein F6X51_11880 [Methylobacterium planeticum]|uniref:Uncharacterized protein n=1 Tax=Methylobacterium planeticum TaxID=2615211 RepID=A0A6N6MSF7_9HYPH|nr:hypothetical protein F6X51_11880 [Methylobacterium planeticum]